MNPKNSGADQARTICSDSKDSKCFFKLNSASSGGLIEKPPEAKRPRGKMATETKASGALRGRGPASATTHGQSRGLPNSVLALSLPLGGEEPVAPTNLPATPNLPPETRQGSKQREVTSPPPRPSGPTVLGARVLVGHRQEGRHKAKRREITAYGFVYQSAATGHGVMRRNRPLPSQLTTAALTARRQVGSATGGCEFLRLGSPVVAQVELAYQLTRKAGREGKAGSRSAAAPVARVAAASLSHRRGAAPLPWAIVVVGGRAGRRVHVSSCRRRCGRCVHVVMVVVVVAVPADAGEGVGGGPALRPQVVIVGGGRRGRVFVWMVVEGLRGGGLQAQFVVGRTGPAAARAAQRHQAAAARQRGAEHSGHELLVRGLGVQRRPARRLPLVLPTALGSICGGAQSGVVTPAAAADRGETTHSRKAGRGARSGACSRTRGGWDGTFRLR